MNKDKLQDLLLFYSSNEDKYVTLSEYVERMKNDQKDIYYASSESINSIKMLPQVEMIKEKGYEVLYLTEYLDEFVIKTIGSYKEHNFINVTDKSLDLDTEEEKEQIKKINEDYKDMFDIMKKGIPDNVKEIKFTNKLKTSPVCLSSMGDLSIEMEKIINTMPNQDEKVSAELVLEINDNHEISKKIKELYNNKENDELEKYGKILYNQARLISGLSIENPKDLTDLICDMISK